MKIRKCVKMIEKADAVMCWFTKLTFTHATEK